MNRCKSFKNVCKKWFIINADSKILGRVSSKIVSIIRGKHKVGFVPNMNYGDNIIIINVDKIILTGEKFKYKVYTHHTGYPSGQRNINIKKFRENFPKRILEKSIKGMVPKNKLSKKIFENLFIYLGNNHPHLSQNPQKIDF